MHMDYVYGEILTKDGFITGHLGLKDNGRISEIGKGIPSGTIMSALGKKPVAYTGIPGGIYRTPVRGRSVIIPISWRLVF